MSLNLPELVHQVHLMGEDTALRLRHMQGVMPKILQAMKDIAQSDAALLERKIARAGEGWFGAVPTEETIDQSHPPPPHPKTLNVLGADGSQIHPDRHAPTMYYLINTGAIHLRYGSGIAPHASSQALLFFKEEDLYDDGAEISSATINARRDLLELGKLAALAANCQADPTLAIMDNGLLLWFAMQPGESHRLLVESLLKEYLLSLSALQLSGAALAGFIDRPRHTSVVSLLHLASIALEDISEESLRANPYRGYPDRTIFQHLLADGHRSSIFIQNTKLNRQFRKAGHEVHFFYLNTGKGNPIARIEIPQWVAHHPGLLDIVHSGILEQCKTTAGFPYALIRAHELAVVSHEDRQSLESMIQRSLLQQGVAAWHSQKAESKSWTARRRRHRI